MTQEQKLDIIYQTVMDIKAQTAADRTICTSRHEAIDERIHGLHRVVKGESGVESKQTLLTQRFDRLEAKVLAWVSVGTIAGSIIGPTLLEWAKAAK